MLSALLGRPVHIERIRAGRQPPGGSGMRAQHVTAVRAVGLLCGARLAGDSIGSNRLEFAPRHRPRAGDFTVDVALAREGGSAGAAPLVLQAMLLPLALAAGRSSCTVRGGTAAAHSPPFDYLCDVWLHALARMNLRASVALRRFGWYPVGGGEIAATTEGGWSPAPIDCVERGALAGVTGRVLTTRLPAHVGERIALRAQSALEREGIEANIAIEQVEASSPGVGIFLAADYENARAGASALGERGKPSEVVADEAVRALLACHRTGAAIDEHLADQLLLPAALAAGRSRFSAERVSRHLETNAWVIERFGLARVRIDAPEASHCLVIVEPSGA